MFSHWVDVVCDGLGEDVISRSAPVIMYGVFPVCPWLCLLPNLSKGHSEIVRIWQGLVEKGDKEEERLLLSYLPTMFKLT